MPCAASGEVNAAHAAADEALALDDLMPHADKKLSANQRKRMNDIVSGEVYPQGPPPPPKRPH